MENNVPFSSSLVSSIQFVNFGFFVAKADAEAF